MKGKPHDDGDLPSFGAPLDFQMPDFSGISRMMKMLSWLPAILTGFVLFAISFFAQVVYNGLVQPDYEMTYGSFMLMVLLSLVIFVVSAALIKISTGKKA